MRKFFSKIVVTLILATVLWSGVGFGIQNEKENQLFGVKNVHGVVLGYDQILSDYIKNQCGGFAGLTSESSPEYQECSVVILSVSSQCASLYDSSNEAGSGIAISKCLTKAQGLSTNVYEGLIVLGKKLAGGVMGTVLAVIAGIMQLIFIPVLGVFVKIAAFCLDFALQFTLNSKYITDVNTAITHTWEIIRNFCNIAFIFVLLYSAIKMIVGVANANAKKMVANVIMAAILINFSLFISRVVIDVGNILAVTLYNAAVGSNTMSTVIANTLGLGKWFATTKIQCLVCTEFFIVSTIQMFVMITAIYALSYIAILMFTRSIMLIFLMVLSPIGFMGSVLPKISEYSKMWREYIYDQTIIAPIFLLLFYLIIQIGDGLKPASLAEITASVGGVAATSSLEVAALAAGNTAFTQYFKYILIIILLIVAVKVTKKMSGIVGAVAEKLGGLAVGAAIGVATGGAALAGRQLAGRGATRILESETGKNLRARADRGDAGARMTLAGLEKTSKATFDVRNTKAAGNVMGEYNKLSGFGVEMGKSSGLFSKDGKSTGYAGQRKTEQEAENKKYNEIKKSENADTAGQLAAAGTIAKRKTATDNALNANATHIAAKNRIDTLLDVSGDANMQNAEQAVQTAEAAVRNASAATADAAKADLETAKTARDAVKNPLVAAKRAQHGTEIAEQEKIMRAERIKAEEAAHKNLTNQEKALIARVERSKNYANSVRHGRRATGSWRSSKENREMGDRMESSEPTSAEQENRELLKEIREAQRELKQQQNP